MVYYISRYLTGNSDFEKGLALFNAIKPNLTAGVPSEVDFTGAGGVSSSFLHGFLGESFTLVGIDAAKKLLVLKNLSKGQADMIRKYITDFKELVVVG